MARKVDRMSEGDWKYQRQWASTVASNTLPEGEEGEDSDER